MLRTFHVVEEDRELMAALFSRLAVCMDPNVDEMELFEILFEYFSTDPLIDVISVDILAQLARTTVYNKKLDIMH